MLVIREAYIRGAYTQGAYIRDFTVWPLRGAEYEGWQVNKKYTKHEGEEHDGPIFSA